ncbi:hypothetical protein K9F62_07740 [Desulfovibrio sp. JY]|nr:hypothetical protein K9F62_07740 [Desulfovibrio sp. JY]
MRIFFALLFLLLPCGNCCCQEICSQLLLSIGKNKFVECPKLEKIDFTKTINAKMIISHEKDVEGFLAVKIERKYRNCSSNEVNIFQSEGFYSDKRSRRCACNKGNRDNVKVNADGRILYKTNDCLLTVDYESYFNFFSQNKWVDSDAKIARAFDAQFYPNDQCEIFLRDINKYYLHFGMKSEENDAQNRYSTLLLHYGSSGGQFSEIPFEIIADQCPPMEVVVSIVDFYFEAVGERKHKKELGSCTLEGKK